MNLIKIPQRFMDDHAERDLETPEVIKATKTHYFIKPDDPALPELLDDAEHYQHPCYFDRVYFGLCMSARATVKAIKKMQNK